MSKAAHDLNGFQLGEREIALLPSIMEILVEEYPKLAKLDCLILQIVGFSRVGTQVGRIDVSVSRKGLSLCHAVCSYDYTNYSGWMTAEQLANSPVNLGNVEPIPEPSIL